MIPDKGEDLIKRNFREFMREELRRPELLKAKKSFLKTHFPPSPLVLLLPRILVPALSVLLVFLLANQFYFKQIKTHSELIEPGMKIFESEMNFSDDLPVSVKRVSSNTGTPLVFQKVVEGIPVSVVWIF